MAVIVAKLHVHLPPGRNTELRRAPCALRRQTEDARALLQQKKFVGASVRSGSLHERFLPQAVVDGLTVDCPLEL
jgi:hypothetical protein